MQDGASRREVRLFDRAVADWRTLTSDDDAEFDREDAIDATDGPTHHYLGYKSGARNRDQCTLVPDPADAPDETYASGLDKRPWNIWVCKPGQKIAGNTSGLGFYRVLQQFAAAGSCGLQPKLRAGAR